MLIDENFRGVILICLESISDFYLNVCLFAISKFKMAAILKFSKKSNESLNNKLHHFLYIFGDKKPDETVILVIRGHILP